MDYLIQNACFQKLSDDLVQECSSAYDGLKNGLSNHGWLCMSVGKIVGHRIKDSIHGIHNCTVHVIKAWNSF